MQRITTAAPRAARSTTAALAIRLSASMALLVAIGCGSDDAPPTPPCKGLINVTVSVPGSGGDLQALNQYRTLEITGIDPAGSRWLQTENPPLTTTQVAVRAPSTGITPGAYQFRAVSAATSPATSTAATQVEVKYVGRTAAQSGGDTCLTATLPLAVPSRMDLCLDLCDSEVRCGKRGVGELLSCQSSCREHAAEFTQQQADWVTEWTNFYKKQAGTTAADAAAKAKTKVQTLVGQYEGCNFAACSAVEDCGVSVLSALINPQ